MTLKVINKDAYKPMPMLEGLDLFELRVIAKIDIVPGAWHNPIDLMNWIAQHSYVQFVELVEKP